MADNLDQFLSDVQNNPILRREISNAVTGLTSSVDIANQIIHLATQHGYSFTADEYQQRVMEEFNLVFKYHRSILHYHLLNVRVVPVTLHNFPRSSLRASEHKAPERKW